MQRHALSVQQDFEATGILACKGVDGTTLKLFRYIDQCVECVRWYTWEHEECVLSCVVNSGVLSDRVRTDMD